jgi:hypothetical protein
MPVLGFGAGSDVTDEQHQEPKADRPDLDERVSIPLEPEDALRRLLNVDPDAKTADKADRPQEGSHE